MKIRELTPAQLISVPCPTCGARRKQKCTLSTGKLRKNPHRDRRLAASDAATGYRENRRFINTQDIDLMAKARELGRDLEAAEM